MPGDYDWGKLSSSSSIMDLDGDHARTASTSAAKKLEFVDGDSEALGLNGLDISFDAQTSDDGKIRVRIHPSSAASTPLRARSPALSDDQSMWGGSDASAPSAHESFFSSSSTSPSPDDQLGPFLGIGSADSHEFGSHFSGMSLEQSAGISFPLDSAFDFGSDNLFSTSSSNSRKRVRIALKSLPGEGREGGEWEVQLC